VLAEASIRAIAAPRTRFTVGNLKGVGRIYEQTFIDTYAKVAFSKLYDRKTPITAADLLNDRVVPFFEEHEVKLLGKTPMQTFLDAMPMTKEKMIAA
jgi:hypothetical protein